MRYMNLACLLMTLVCLLTILLFSNSNSTSSSSQVQSSANTNNLLASRRANNDLGSDLMDSLESHLLRAQAQTASQDFNEADAELDSDSDRNKEARFKRRKSDSLESSSSSATKVGEKDQREVEETTQSAPAEQDDEANYWSSSSSRPNRPAGNLFGADAGNSLIDPIFSRILQDMNIGTLFKSLRRAANETAGKPIVRKSKNGATIIISSNFNETNKWPLPSLLDKLLPPGLLNIATSNGQSQVKSNSSSGIATATITINSEPLLAASSGSPFGAFQSPFESLFSSARQPQHPSMFMTAEPMPFRSPFGPLMSASPLAAMPPPSIFNMIMRSRSPLDAEEDSKLPIGSSMTTPNQKAETKNNETITAQASQITSNATAKPESSKPDSEVEILDLSRGNRQPSSVFRSPFAPNRLAGSMIFSSGSVDAPFQLPFGPSISPFMSMQPPQMILVGGSSGFSPVNDLPSPLNPLLRKILNNVMGELSSGDDKSKAERKSRSRAASSFSPNWVSLGNDLGEDSATDEQPADRWEGFEQMAKSSKQLKAKHRSDDELDADSAELVSGLQMEQSQPPFMESPDGLLAGSIRQTIRGPGMSFERIFELPSSRMQQVPASLKSQSLSRADNLEMSGELTNSRAAFPIPTSTEDYPPPGGFFARLLSDISRHSFGDPSQTSRGMLIMKNRSDDELDEQPEASRGFFPEPTIVKVSAKPAMGQSMMGDSVFFQPANQLATSLEVSHKDKQGESKSMPIDDSSSSSSSVESQADSGDAQNFRRVKKAKKYLAIGKPSRNFHSIVARKPVKLDGDKAADFEAPADSQYSDQEQVDVPFSSPSSPMFGFPALSMRSPKQTSVDEQVEKNKPTLVVSSIRQPRSFTYHSNNELANSRNSTSQPANQPSSLPRRRFWTEAHIEPASRVMGRRADDSGSIEAVE